MLLNQVIPVTLKPMKSLSTQVYNLLGAKLGLIGKKKKACKQNKDFCWLHTWELKRK